MSEELSPYRDSSEFYLTWLAKVAAAAGCTPTSLQVQVYLERLEKLTFDEMTRAAQRTMEDWGQTDWQVGKMPPLTFILDRALSPASPGPEARNRNLRPLLPPETLPTPWKREESTEDERVAIIAEGRQRLDEVKAALRKARSFPEHRQAAEALILRRSPSQIPEDKEERRLWAIRRAREILIGDQGV